MTHNRKVTDEDVLRVLREAGGHISSQAIASALDVSSACVKQHIVSLREAGHEIEAKARTGMRLVAGAAGCDTTPQEEPVSQPEPEERDKAGADLTPGADAPDTSPGPDPAAGAPVPPAHEAPAPSGAEDVLVEELGVFTVRVESAGVTDPEVRAIAACVAALRGLEQEARDRAVNYLLWRFAP